MDHEDFFDDGDDSGHEGLGGGSSEEVSLPKTTITKMIQEMLPTDVVCAKETRDILINCCTGNANFDGSIRTCSNNQVEFVHLIASEANEACEKESKKTIMPEHVVTALQVNGKAKAKAKKTPFITQY